MIVPYVAWTASLTVALLILCVAAPAVATGAAWAFAVALVLGVLVQWGMHGAPHVRHRSRPRR